jgi:hypothetical protein
VIFIGLDDTDVQDSPGTNQLAKRIVREATSNWRCWRIVRHQLFVDSRIPYTSQNGSASILFEARGSADPASLWKLCESSLRSQFVEGSDPGLCMALQVPAAVMEFGRLCKSDVVDQASALEVANRHGLILKGLGGTNGGVIGALAAVGLAATGNDGRVVQHDEWPDDLTGEVDVQQVIDRGIHIIERSSGEVVTTGRVDVGKHLRPNRRSGSTILFVNPTESNSGWSAVKLK